jgi:hypothetical protein
MRGALAMVRPLCGNALRFGGVFPLNNGELTE